MTTELAKLELSNDVLDIIKTGDLGRLNDQQQLQYYIYECRRIGLDPASRPFAWIKLNGKLVLYADRRCGDMLSTKHGYSTEILEGPCLKKFGDASVLYCRVKATMQNGRSVEDIGTLPASDIVNGLMKVLSKAVRRATLRLAGWGGLDESELETIPASAKSQIVMQPRPVVVENDAAHDPPAQDTPALDALREELAAIEDTTLLKACRVWLKHAKAVGSEAGGDLDYIHDANQTVLGATKIGATQYQMNGHVAALELRAKASNPVFCDIMDLLELADTGSEAAQVLRDREIGMNSLPEEAQSLLRRIATRRVQELENIGDAKAAAQWLKNALAPKDPPKPPNGGAPKPDTTPANDSDPERAAIESDGASTAVSAVDEWRMHAETKRNAFELARSFLKREREFKRAKIADQCLAITIQLLMPLLATDSRNDAVAFIRNQAPKRAA